MWLMGKLFNVRKKIYSILDITQKHVVKVKVVFLSINVNNMMKIIYIIVYKLIK